jgi:hypothetical protein
MDSKSKLHDQLLRLGVKRKDRNKFLTDHFHKSPVTAWRWLTGRKQLPPTEQSILDSMLANAESEQF